MHIPTDCKILCPRTQQQCGKQHRGQQTYRIVEQRATEVFVRVTQAWRPKLFTEVLPLIKKYFNLILILLKVALSLNFYYINLYL